MMIERKKTDLHQQMERYAMGEEIDMNPDYISTHTKNEITKITEDHNRQLQFLREQYDEFLKSAETEFFHVLKMIKANPQNVSKKYTSDPLEEEPYVSGELAKVAREFLAQQEQKLGLKNTQAKPHESKALQEKNYNFDGFSISSQKSNKNGKDSHIKVNELLQSEFAKQSKSVFDFHRKSTEKENSNDASIISNTNFVDYNLEAKSGGYMMLSLDKRSQKNPDQEDSSYYASTKKHLKYPESENMFTWNSDKKYSIEDSREEPSQKKLTEDDFAVVTRGDHHSAGITKEGMVFTWGRGIFGQLGHGDDESYKLPKLVDSLSKIQISAVSCGWQHTMALTKGT